ncbi:MAG: ADP-ribosylglycohydrolase family protein [Microcoleaceae cyanobacterium MO_207.B10]|nr:ADP-ribosylglycohydrolase family protein [Microcoleaceae cyanobacterium MO_207.B10]
MQYSLLRKFQGAFLGASFGDIVGSQFKQLAEPNPNHYKWKEITIICAKSLIRKNGLNQKDWQETCKQWQEKWNQKSSIEISKNSSLEPSKIIHSKAELAKLGEMVNNKPSDFTYISNKSNLLSPKPNNAVIASLPIALLYHEDEFKLQQKLQQWGEVWGNHLEINPVNLAIGYVMAQALTEKLEPLTLIPKTIDYIGEQEPLVGHLKQVNILINQGANLETATVQLSKNAKFLEQQQLSSEEKPIPQSSTLLIPVALALYCFLSTPENLGLAVLRAARTKWATETCSIVGALSGAYNSSAGIPVKWRQTMGDELFGTTNETEIMNLAKSLWAVWCGVYNSAKMIDPLPAVAASNVIRPRSHKTSGY